MPQGTGDTREKKGCGMVVTRTPFRISLFGGGTDYPLWSQRHGGAVLGMAIDKYCYIRLTPMQDATNGYHITYSRQEQVETIAAIQHPAVRAIYGEEGVLPGLAMVHESDLPARSGLGSSSSFVVGLLHAVRALAGERPDRRWLAQEAIRIEQQVIRENVGSQDQIWAAYGGLNHIRFHPSGDFEVTPLSLSAGRREELCASLLVVSTGMFRIASEIAGRQIENIDQREAQLHGIAALVDQAAAWLTDEHLPAHRLGELLHHSWMLKRQLAQGVSNSVIDEIYAEAIAGGASGGKLLGAGNGGFMVFFIDPTRRAALAARLSRLRSVAVGIDDAGSVILP
ncbi:kinase [Elstera sp.]|uniref:GHMP family kinase ATP-binding protein n=1 Tax=Elstera sp. TaxID=1916664 RepID=UPI0037C0EB8E